MKAVLFAILAYVVGVTCAVAQNYQVRPGDQLRIEVLEDSSLNRNVLVTPDGSFSFPFAGSVRAGGFTTNQIASRLTAEIGANFAAPPNVFVSVNRLTDDRPAPVVAAPRTITVYFIGEVGDPGERTLEPGITFLQALSRSGGLTNFAADRRIQLRRTDPVTLVETVTEINYRALQDGAFFAQNVILGDGDVILVPQRGLFE